MTAAQLPTMPGMVDGHTHTSQQLLRGRLADEYPMIWTRFLVPFESTLRSDDVYYSALLYCIQAIKAGILEIADLLIINKADLPGADNTERALRANLDLGINPHLNHDAAHRINSVEMAESNKGWVPPILKTVAINDQGISEVVESLLQHRTYLNETGLWTRREKERLHNEVNHLLQKRLMERWRKQVPHQQYDAVLKKDTKK